MKTLLTKKFITLGMASLLTVGALTGCGTSVATEVPKPETTTTQIATSTSPMGERKMIDFNGNRYVFLNNGEAFELTKEQLGKEVAKQHEGTLYTLTNYNQSFRMAFEYQDAFYIIENVGKSDDSAIDIQAYLKDANLKNKVIYADIFDLLGVHILNGLEQKEALDILALFEKAQIGELTTEQHEAIAKAQAEGAAYLLEFMLEDGTTFTSYVIPSMNYITIGDYTCVIDDLQAQLGGHFDNLEIQEEKIMN